MKHSTKWALSTAITLACAALVTAPVAHAQEPDGDDTSLSLILEEVMVTAQRREQSANEVGMDIQTYSGDTLKTLNINQVEDLSTLIPSFTIAQSYQGVPTYTLRGIGFNTINISAKSTVGTYVDEVAYPYPILNSGPMYDVQRVEVLKGPQGTLFGRNTTAGLINLVTNKPTEDFEAMASAELGNFETFNFEGFISGPITENLGARLAVRSENSGEGWQKSNTRDEELGEVDRQGARLSLAWEATERLYFDFSYNWWQNQSDMRAAQAIGFTPSTAPGSPNSVFNAPGLIDYVANYQPTDNDQADWAPYGTRSQDVGTGLGLPGDLAQDASMGAFKLHFTYDFSDSMQLVGLTGYHDLDREGLTDFSGAPYELLLQDLDGEIESFSQELRLQGTTENTTWLLGAYYSDDELLDSNRTLLGENANVPLIRFYTLQLLGTPFNSGGYTPLEASQAFRTYEDHAEIEAESWSVFGNVNWELSDALTLNAGLRYTQDKQDYVGCSRDFNGNMLPNVNVTNRFLFFSNYGQFPAEISQGECNTYDPTTGTFGPVVTNLDEDNVAWRLGLDWWLDEDLLMFATVSQGAKNGETPVNAANLAEQNAPVTQEQLLAYELGVKATLADQRVQANATAFYYDYDDKQLSVYFADPVYTALSRLDNIPNSNAYGLDTEITWLMTENLTAIGAATWLHTEVQDYQGIDAAGQPADFDGRDFLYSPDFAGTLTLIYGRPITSSLGLSGTLNNRYQATSYANLGGDDSHRIDAYNLVNASIGLYSLDQRWDVSLWAENLTDEYYWLTVTQGANTVIRFPGKSRTYGVTLRYNF